ncbi:hypothetical protein O181_102971 [Austropuccinia psidii MF-1]|uniref:CCHC-type domain-containing protein n=1 Tax=Austropuccinia psidii MF-1 TaxID=1389203 RepID=A0A9Q3PK27_9BASI|nr:hypothetical protein [Austropuccinia psidii MF-1]
MSPVHLRKLGIPRNQTEDREGLEEDTLDTKPQTIGLEGYGSSSSAPPTPQRSFSMEHGKQEVQPSIPLSRTWSKFPEDMSQRDTIKRSYDALLENKAQSPSQYQDEDNMSYSEKEALIQLPEASSWPKFPFTGEYDHMELIDYFDGLFIDVPRIPDYWMNAILNTAFKGHASIWYTEMKEIHGRRNWPWWKSHIIQNNNKFPTQIPGELEHAVKCRCNQSFTLHEIANTLQDVRKRKNIGKYAQYRRSSFKEKQPLRVDFKDKPQERVAEVAKKKNSCHNCGSTDHYFNKCSKAKEKDYSIEQVPEEESSTEDSESDSMGDAIREKSDEDKDPREEFLVEYQEETQLEIQDIKLEEGMPQDTANKNFCKHTQDTKTFLVTPTVRMSL